MASHLFPFGFNFGRDTEQWRQLVCCLPAYERAKELVDHFHRMVNTQAVAVPPSQTDDILSQFYPRKELIRAESESLSEGGLHNLGLLFALLAIGCANDDSLPQLNAEAESYAHLTRATLCSYNIIEHSSLSTVQTILALCAYTKSAEISRRNDMTWTLMSFGCQIAMSVSTSLKLHAR